MLRYCDTEKLREITDNFNPDIIQPVHKTRALNVDPDGKHVISVATIDTNGKHFVHTDQSMADEENMIHCVIWVKIQNTIEPHFLSMRMNLDEFNKLPTVPGSLSEFDSLYVGDSETYS